MISRRREKRRPLAPTRSDRVEVVKVAHDGGGPRKVGVCDDGIGAEAVMVGAGEK